VEPSRNGGLVRIVSPLSVSILMTSAPMSASIREQWRLAMVVEKSRTRRSAKAFVVVPSCLSANCIPGVPLEQRLFFLVRAPPLDGGD
jgi:hypothetical protein